MRFSWWPKASVHIQGEPTGAACTFKMRPTTAPSASTSKSSSLHSPDGREAEARLSNSAVTFPSAPPGDPLRPLAFRPPPPPRRDPVGPLDPRPGVGEAVGVSLAHGLAGDHAQRIRGA